MCDSVRSLLPPEGSLAVSWMIKDCAAERKAVSSCLHWLLSHSSCDSFLRRKRQLRWKKCAIIPINWLAVHLLGYRFLPEWKITLSNTQKELFFPDCLSHSLFFLATWSCFCEETTRTRTFPSLSHLQEWRLWRLHLQGRIDWHLLRFEAFSTVTMFVH